MAQPGSMHNAACDLCSHGHVLRLSMQCTSTLLCGGVMCEEPADGADGGFGGGGGSSALGVSSRP
jgi:hypothetical protein